MKKIILLIISLLLVNGCNNITKEKALFELEGNPSTGFEWTCTDESNYIDINYQIESKEKEKTISGAPVIYKFFVQGKKQGTTTIKCIYKRPWEENEIETIKEYQIEVDNNLNVKIK